MTADEEKAAEFRGATHARLKVAEAAIQENRMRFDTVLASMSEQSTRIETRLDTLLAETRKTGELIEEKVAGLKERFAGLPCGRMKVYVTLSCGAAIAIALTGLGLLWRHVETHPQATVQISQPKTP